MEELLRVPPEVLLERPWPRPFWARRWPVEPGQPEARELAQLGRLEPPPIPLSVERGLLAEAEAQAHLTLVEPAAHRER